jgi:hypothetical protein
VHRSTTPCPSRGDLADLVARIAPGERERRLLLVDNPMQLFGFADPAVDSMRG